MGVCWRQDEHPLAKGVLEGEDESSGVTQEECQDKKDSVSREPTGLVPSQEPPRESNLAPARVPDKGGERSQQRETSQEEVCQAEEEQEHGQGARRGEEMCQAHTDL